MAWIGSDLATPLRLGARVARIPGGAMDPRAALLGTTLGAILGAALGRGAVIGARQARGSDHVIGKWSRHDAAYEQGEVLSNEDFVHSILRVRVACL